MEHMSPLDTAFLDLEDAHSALHIGGVAVFEGPVPTPEEMAQVYERSIAVNPRYRRRMRRVPMDLTWPSWVTDTGFDPEYHLRRTAVAGPGGPAELDRLIGRIMSVPLDESRPLWEAWVVEGLANGQWALLTKLHHSMVDGLAGMSLFTDMLDGPEPRPAAASTTAPRLTDTLGVRLAAGRRAAHDVLAAALAPRHTLRVAGQTLTGSLRYVRALWPTDQTSLSGRLGSPRRYRTLTVDLADVQLVRRALGGTVNDVALAIVTRGLRELLIARGERPSPHAARCLVPVSTRAAGGRSGGNEVSALLVDLPVDFADPAVSYSAVVARTRALKLAHEADAGQLGVALAGHLPAPLVSGTLRLVRRLPQRMITTVVTNVPGPPLSVSMLGRRMLALYPYVPIAERLRVGIALTSYCDRMHVGITSDRDSVGDVDVLVNGITNGLATLVKVADATQDWTT